VLGRACRPQMPARVCRVRARVSVSDVFEGWWHSVMLSCYKAKVVFWSTKPQRASRVCVCVVCVCCVIPQDTHDVSAQLVWSHLYHSVTVMQRRDACNSRVSSALSACQDTLGCDAMNPCQPGAHHLHSLL
jgi:hypothetical protein